MATAKVTFHRIRDPDLLLRASINFSNQPSSKVRLEATDGEAEYAIDTLNNEDLKQFARDHGYQSYQNCYVGFKHLVYRLLFHINPPADVEISADLCLFIRKHTNTTALNTTVSYKIGLRPFDGYACGQFPSFASLKLSKKSISGQRMFWWVDSAFKGCTQLYRELESANEAAEEAKVAGRGVLGKAETVHGKTVELQMKVEALAGTMELLA